MTSVLSPITKVKFDSNDAFSNLAFQEWKPGYSDVSQDQLMLSDFGDDSTFLVMFLSAVAPQNEFNERQILSVKASNEGILEKVYGPVIQANEEGGLIVRSGKNIFPITQDGRNFTAGDLTGELESYELKIKAGTPDEKTISVPRIDFVHSMDSSIIYSIRVLIKEGVDGEGLKQIARSKKDSNIAPFLMVSKGGGSSVDAFKITEITEGEYPVLAIDRNTGGEWGNSYLIVLGEKGVWANKSLKTLLDKNYEAFCKHITAGKPVTLRVANIRDTPNGYKTCDSALFLREARSLPSAPAKPQLSGAIDVKPVSDNNGSLPF